MYLPGTFGGNEYINKIVILLLLSVVVASIDAGEPELSSFSNSRFLCLILSIDYGMTVQILKVIRKFF